MTVQSRTIKVLEDGIGEVELLTDRGDLMVVNAARVSNDKRVRRIVTKEDDDYKQERLDKGMKCDSGLIRYLLRGGHWTPFGHEILNFSLENSGLIDFLMVGPYTPDIFVDRNEEKMLSTLSYLKDNGFRFARRSDGTEIVSASLYGWLVAIKDCFYRYMESPKDWEPFKDGLYDWVMIFDWLSTYCPLSVKHAEMPEPPFDPKSLHIPIGSDGLPANQKPIENDERFAHLRGVTVRIKAPVYVLRQWMRSNVGIVYNEVSRRYVDNPPEFYIPQGWRRRPDKSIKQGSSLETVTKFSGDVIRDWIEKEQQFPLPVNLSECADASHKGSAKLYEMLLESDVAPEVARMILPVCMYSEVVMTARVEDYDRVFDLRCNDEDRQCHCPLGFERNNHAQKETADYARATRELVRYATGDGPVPSRTIPL